MDPNASGQYSTPAQSMQNDNEDQGWVSWAWSFVPAIINTGEEEESYPEMENTGNPSPLQSSFREPIVSVGFYCTKASVTFKVRDKKVFCFMSRLANLSWVKGHISQNITRKGLHQSLIICAFYISQVYSKQQLLAYSYGYKSYVAFTSLSQLSQQHHSSHQYE